MENQNSSLLRLIRASIARRFNLHIDKADEEDVVASIRKNSDFIGANLWTLIFAIFIASIGLNINSTAVIIGAMLISPLMGPIMGVGLGIGINDFELVKKGLRNLFIATLISIVASTLYFWITPLHNVQSELLARTTPTTWDVFIAFLGGLAGIVAGTRKEKSNVIPGVAIATALMPPLCTAGFGLATGNLYYFLGAIYLYFINSVFICISTFLIVRFLNFKKKQFKDKRYGRTVSRYIFITVVISVIPSTFLAYRIVDKSIFENNSRKFVSEQFQFKNTQVVSRNFNYSSKGNEIDILLIGHELPQVLIDSIHKTMPDYKLANTKLNVRQGLNAKREIDLSQIKASILEDVFNTDSAKTYREPRGGLKPDVRAELKILFPQLTAYSISSAIKVKMDSSRSDTLTLVAASFSKQISQAEKNKLRDWLKTRLNVQQLQVLVE